MLSRQFLARIAIASGAVLAFATFTGCGRTQQSASTVSAANDYPSGDVGDETDDESLDLNEQLPDVPSDSVILEDADGGERVMTVFFKGGGAGDRCLNWDVQAYSSDGVQLIKPKRLERRHDDSVKQEGENSIRADLKTVGGRDGFKALVEDGSEIEVIGTVSNCDQTVTMDVNYSGKAVKTRMRQIWEGDPLREGGVGKVKMFLKISKVKKEKRRGRGSRS